jgi:peptidoglycan/LPS O-acetylase OafA/YrhL
VAEAAFSKCTALIDREDLMVLKDFESTKNNNFTLVRLLFAWAVLFGHSFPLTANGSDPLSMLMLPYAWIGSIAVGGFFAISGYLVTASFVQRGASAFVASRALRLYPAIIAYCVVAVLIIGPIGSDVRLADYFSADPWSYFRNVPLWTWNYNLPHVFTHNPFGGGTNGSTWTLPVELRCYLLVLFLGFFGVLDSRLRATIALLGMLFLLNFDYAALPVFGKEPHFAEPLNYFLWGALLWVNRSLVPMSWWLAGVLLACIPVSIKLQYFGLFCPFCVAYVTYMVAYRTPHIDLDKKLGDISYGVYIYAWPIQQLVYRPGQSAWLNTAIATVIIVPLALLSWRFVEKPALKLRKKLSFVPRKPASGVLDEMAESSRVTAD